MRAAKFVRCARCRQRALRQKLLRNLRVLQRGDGGGVQTFLHFGRGTRRRDTGSAERLVEKCLRRSPELWFAKAVEARRIVHQHRLPRRC